MPMISMTPMKNLISSFLWFFLLFMTVTTLCARENIIRLGGKENWQSLLIKDGLTLQKGRGGYFDLLLKDSEYTPDDDTDLLLHFNSLPVKEESSRYLTKDENAHINTEYAKLGSGCGVFQGENILTLVPRPGSLFSPQTTWTDFTFEFWLYPATLGDGESVFVWKGYRQFRGTLVPQRVECKIERRSLVWTFENFFGSSTEEPIRFDIKGIQKLIPRSWHHHMLTFDSTNGFIEYSIDGVPIGTRYATPSGNDEPVFPLPWIGASENTSLVFGSRLTGFIDEFRVSRTVVKKPLLGKYRQAHGRAVTKVFDMGYSGTVVKRIDALLEKPQNSEINFYVRSSDVFNTIERLKEDWIPFKPGTAFKGKVKGRYLQLMVEFFPDGKNEISPRLFEIDVVYEPDLPPVSPVGLKAVAGNGSVTLSWQQVTEDDVKGYYLFYGEAPLNYLGEDAKEGASPIDVGNINSFTLTGLANGKLYYFAVAAYDSSTPPHLSPFLEEKSARPSEVLQ